MKLLPLSGLGGGVGGLTASLGAAEENRRWRTIADGVWCVVRAPYLTDNMLEAKTARGNAVVVAMVGF